MSFLNLKDIAGPTIIIDATLTDAGRRYMVQGNFTVAKFALGDDEIDYELVSGDLNGNGGTPTLTNADTTPLLEASSRQNANINYGLMDHERKDLFYIPILKINNKQQDSALPQTSSLDPGPTDVTPEVYYLSVNNETTKKLKNTVGFQAANILESNVVEKTKIIIESGIDLSPTGSYKEFLTSGPDPLPISDKRTAVDREAFILQTELLDNAFYVYCDNRFVTNVLVPSSESKFSNNIRGDSTVNFETLNFAEPISDPTYIENFSTFYAPAIANLVYNRGLGQDLDISVICGPRGSAVAINLKIDPMLAATSAGDVNYKYSTYGTTGAYLFGGDFGKYDYIDTALYIEGITSAARISIPIRIIRYAGT